MMMVAVRMINAAVVMRVPPHGFGLVCWSWLVSFSFVFGFVQCGVEHVGETFGLVGREPVVVSWYAYGPMEWPSRMFRMMQLPFVLDLAVMSWLS